MNSFGHATFYQSYVLQIQKFFVIRPVFQNDLQDKRYKIRN